MSNNKYVLDFLMIGCKFQSYAESYAVGPWAMPVVTGEPTESRTRRKFCGERDKNWRRLLYKQELVSKFMAESSPI